MWTVAAALVWEGAMVVRARAAETAAHTAAAAADPVADSIVALERASWHAWQQHDTAFFQRFLSDDHVEVGAGGVTRKAGVLATVASPACVVRSYSLDSFSVARLAPSTALVTYHATQETTCSGQRVPSPAWASSLYMRRDHRWVDVAHQQSAGRYAAKWDAGR